MKTLICEICQQDMARFDKVSYPLKGSMFEPMPECKTDMPYVFHPDLSWNEFRCPWCQNMPFVVNFDTYEQAHADLPVQLLTPEGYFSITPNPPQCADQKGATPSSLPKTSGVSCPICQREFKKRGHMLMHYRKCREIKR